jgi:hypothetical protein
LTFASDLDPRSVKPGAFEAYREDDAKNILKPAEYKLGEVRLIDSRTVEINVPSIGKEALANRTDEKGNIQVKPPISLSYKLKSKSGKVFEQKIYATINSLPKK